MLIFEWLTLGSAIQMAQQSHAIRRTAHLDGLRRDEPLRFGRSGLLSRTAELATLRPPRKIATIECLGAAIFGGSLLSTPTPLSSKKMLK